MEKDNMRYLKIKNLSTILREIKSNHGGDIHCLKCLHSFRIKNKLECYKNLCKK